MPMTTVDLVWQGLQSKHVFGSLLLCMEAAGIEPAAGMAPGGGRAIHASAGRGTASDAKNSASTGAMAAAEMLWVWPGSV